MTMSHQHSMSRTPWPLWMLGALALASLATIAAARWSGWTAMGQDAPVQWTRALQFQDHPSGAVLVLDAANGAEIARYEGEQGFVRGSLRALIRERKRHGGGTEQPFLLQGHSDGRMSLRDPTTGMRIPLDSFGPSNLALFVPLGSTHLATSAHSQGNSP